MQTKLRNSWKSGRSGAGDEKQQFEYLLFEKMRLCPTSKKLDFADKIVKFMEIWEVRSRGRKKQFEDLLFEKMTQPPKS